MEQSEWEFRVRFSTSRCGPRSKLNAGLFTFLDSFCSPRIAIQRASRNFRTIFTMMRRPVGGAGVSPGLLALFGWVGL